FDPAAPGLAAARQPERHVDRHALGLAIRHLAVEAPAAVEVDDRVHHGRIGTVEHVVAGEGEHLPAPPELHLLEAARLPALDARTMLRELHNATPRAAP